MFMDCQFPRGIMYLSFFYVNSLLMFINFYVKTYVMGQVGKVDNRKVTSNGTKVINNSTKVTINGAIDIPLEDKKHY